MKRILSVLVFSILLVNLQKVSAQAFDGKGDTKLFLGYANAKGYSAGQLKFEKGFSSLLSVGAAWTYFFIKEDSNTIGTDDPISGIFDKSEIGIFMNFHLNKPLRLDDKSDLYIGPYTSLKSTGVQGGYKYNFSERFGVYAEVSQGFFNVFDFSSETSSGSSSYKTRTLISAGLTINIIR